ncbi:hypothetical protein QBC47DRAFT_465453 [Echria macrotheca]|uniref:CPAF-like PDZ domain-containing protein n=1 Tax=Echria macrotheca TaxID=438768 RepID=A0AAJ0F5Y3_9PEZI|nr:hypothetical protein QBC47DRAFT_465453 [Echria macrotheca]
MSLADTRLESQDRHCLGLGETTESRAASCGMQSPRGSRKTPQNLTEGEALLPKIPAVPVKPSLAFDCLKSIPLDKERALAHINFLRPLWEWQSTIDYNKNPPRGYLSGAVDVPRGLDSIASKLQTTSSGYANMFEFLADLYILQGRVRDVHFSSFSMLFDLWDVRWGRQFVSISEDGRTLPRIFLYDDAKHNKHGYRPSPVTTIDGAPVLDVLQRVSYQNWGYHDPDARFNSLFPSVSKDANIQNAGPNPFALGLSDKTTVGFKNGSQLTFDNIALIRANVSGIASGTDLYRNYGVEGEKAPSPTAAQFYKMAESRYVARFNLTEAFPPPFATSLGGDVAGFLPDGPLLKDAAVLAINEFVNSVNINDLNDSSFLTDIYTVPINLITKAKAEGRTKLIIDLQGNGGGDLPWSFVGYRQLDGTPFPNPKSFLGPVATPFGNLTAPALMDPEWLKAYNFTTPWTTPPFAPENITILTDGECASACALFTAILTHAHSIRAVTLGGRPLYAPMQAVGRTLCGPAANFGRFPALPPPPPTLTLPSGAVPTTPPPLRLRVQNLGSLPGRWGENIRFSLANITPLGDKMDALPLQFRYQAAHCKVFFTWEMTRSIEKVWERVMDVAWKGGKCVDGSSTGPGGTMGTETRGYDKEVEEEVHGYTLNPQDGNFGCHGVQGGYGSTLGKEREKRITTRATRLKPRPSNKADKRLLYRLFCGGAEYCWSLIVTLLSGNVKRLSLAGTKD